MFDKKRCSTIIMRWWQMDWFLSHSIFPFIHIENIILGFCTALNFSNSKLIFNWIPSWVCVKCANYLFESWMKRQASPLPNTIINQSISFVDVCWWHSIKYSFHRTTRNNEPARKRPNNYGPFKKVLIPNNTCVGNKKKSIQCCGEWKA